MIKSVDEVANEKFEEIIKALKRRNTTLSDMDRHKLFQQIVEKVKNESNSL